MFPIALIFIIPLFYTKSSGSMSYGSVIPYSQSRTVHLRSSLKSISGHLLYFQPSGKYCASGGRYSHKLSPIITIQSPSCVQKPQSSQDSGIFISLVAIIFALRVFGQSYKSAHLAHLFIGVQDVPEPSHRIYVGIVTDIIKQITVDELRHCKCFFF